MKTLRFSAVALAALTIAASTTRAAVIDLGNVLGSSGGYSSQAYYQGMVGGQPMTAAQQAYADQEDQLRLMGFQLELGGDAALGQLFYHIAYGLTPPSSALDLAGGGGDPPPSITPSGPITGGDGGDTGGGGPPPAAVPEASTWAMMLIGFAGLGLAVYRRTRTRGPGFTG